MKKVYEKPQVYMERFELSQNIALCDWKLGSGDPTSCRIENDRLWNDGYISSEDDSIDGGKS